MIKNNRTEILRRILAARFFVLFLCWPLVCADVAAQNPWQPTNGPYGGEVKALLTNSAGDIFAGTDGGGIFRSTDRSKTWIEINTGLTNFVVNALATNSSKEIFAGTNGGVFRSSDDGEHWHSINNGLQDTKVISLTIDTSTENIFAGTIGGGIFRSTDHGNTWKVINDGLTNTNAQALAINQSTGHIFAGTGGGVFRSTNNGDSWTPSSLKKFVRSLAVNLNNQIFAGTSGDGVFRSIDNGNTWKEVGLLSRTVNAFAINSKSGLIFAGAGNGVFLSTDDGTNWAPIKTGLIDTLVHALVIHSNGEIFAGTSGKGIFRSIDNGDSWISAHIGLRNTVVENLVIGSNEYIFAGTHVGLSRSSDNGTNWTPINTGLLDTYVLSLVINPANKYVFAGTRMGGVFLSKNSGESWIPIRNELPSVRVETLAINSREEVFAGTNGRGVFRSVNNGDSWEAINTDLTHEIVLSLAINQSTGHIFAGTGGGGVFHSTNNGDSWTQASVGLTDKIIQSLVINSRGHIFAGTNGRGIFRSNDNGRSWALVNRGLPDVLEVFSLVINKLEHIFAGTNEGVFRSIDDGDTWTLSSSGLLSSTKILSFAIDAKGQIFAGTEGAGVFRATRMPVFSHMLPSPQEAGQRISIEVKLTNEVPIENAFLNYRKAGIVDFSTSPMIIHGDSIQATILEQFVTSRGVDYFIEATDEDGFKAKLPPSVFFSIQVRVIGEGEMKRDAQGNAVPQPNGGEQSAYRLISVPLDLDDKNPRAVLEDDLGPYDKKKWRFYELLANHPDQPYAEIPVPLKMVPGKAFWLIVKEAGKIIDTGPGISNPTDKEYAIPLYPKWNFVANPFNFPIPVNKLRLKSNGQAPILRSYAGSWSPISTQITVFEPFEGYAVDNKLNIIDTLLINSDLSSSNNPLAKDFLSTLSENTLWSIRILAQCQEARDEDNIAVLVSSASNTWDQLDQPEPPVIGEYISVYFPHREWNTLAKTYCIDARPELTDGEVWEFEVKTNIRDKVNLTFEGIGEVPKEFEVWLVDDALKITQNLREQGQYAVAGAGPVAVAGAVAGAEHVKQLKLVVGKHDFVDEKLAEARTIPTTYELFQNFPNPFNPATTIRYGLPKAERVTLKIYNLLGAEVVVIMNDEPQVAGYHAAVWDGRDKNGRVVASGVYVYRMSAGSFIMTKMLALIK